VNGRLCFLDKVFEFLYHNEQTKKTNVPGEYGRNLFGIMLRELFVILDAIIRNLLNG